MLQISERELELDWRLPPPELEQQALAQLSNAESIVRCVFREHLSELGVINSSLEHRTPFEFRARSAEQQADFNVAYIVPTGVGASQGGHAGDATPVLKAMAVIADTVFTHPNVVNASDVNEIPPNALYIEGSLLSAFLMGKIALKPRRHNRVLVIIDSNGLEKYQVAAVNTVNGAHATYGFDCAGMCTVPISMEVAWSSSGRASGIITQLDELFATLQLHHHNYDAIAITSIVDIDADDHDRYLEESKQEAVNPWGGVEAMLTHAVSIATNMPSAHAPMVPSAEAETADFGIVDPRVATEMISYTFFQCVLKGLLRAPTVSRWDDPNAFNASSVNVLVIPRGCFGLPIYAALHQNIKVIAVADKIAAADQTNLVRSLPWQDGQYTEVANYREALGALACLKAGMPLSAITRPLETIYLEKNQEAQVTSLSS